MASVITTEDLAKYTCDKIHEEYVLNNYKQDYKFDFSIDKIELPYNFKNEDFLNYIKETLNIIYIETDDFYYKLRYTGKIKVIN